MKRNILFLLLFLFSGCYDASNTEDDSYDDSEESMDTNSDTDRCFDTEPYEVKLCELCDGLNDDCPEGYHCTEHVSEDGCQIMFFCDIDWRTAKHCYIELFDYPEWGDECFDVEDICRTWDEYSVRCSCFGTWIDEKNPDKI